MFDFWKKKPQETINIAAEHTNVPLSNQMVMLFAEELPMLDSMERAHVYRELEAYAGRKLPPWICCRHVSAKSWIFNTATSALRVRAISLRVRAISRCAFKELAPPWG